MVGYIEKHPGANDSEEVWAEKYKEHMKRENSSFVRAIDYNPQKKEDELIEALGLDKPIERSC